jgi:hypothetical protein
MRFLIAGVLLVLLVTGCGTDATHNSAAPRGESTGQGELGCSVDEQTAVDLDVPGPGMPSPGEAVDALTESPSTLVSKSAGAATVTTLGPGGTVARVFQVTQRHDGWWPASYTECSD